jgi:hypothetical protein
MRKTGTYDSSGRKRTLERSVAATKSKNSRKIERSPEIRGFSHEKAGLGPGSLFVHCNISYC